jgi:hypothetical protein
VAGRPTTPQLRRLLKQATKEQLREARRIAFAHFDAVHRNGLLVERPEQVALEALQIAMDNEPDLRPSKREYFEQRSYLNTYSGGFGTGDRP